MIPDELKKMFGLNSQKDVSMANNIWKMLDEMAESSPEQYKEFIQKNLKEGAQEAKEKKEEKEKPYRIKPEKGFLLEFNVVLTEKYLSVSTENETNIESKLQEKLDISGAKWEEVKKKFKPKFHICLNVCHSDRVKLPLNKNKKEISQISMNKIKEIEVFYYSLQSSKETKPNNNISQLDFCMILNKLLYESLMKEGVNGKKILMSLAISYFEQRLQTDHNPLLKLYNPEQYHKLAFYGVEKFTIQFNSDKTYFFNNSSEMPEFLLEKEVDTKPRPEEKSKETQKILEKPQEQKKQEIKFKEEPMKEKYIQKIQQEKNHEKINELNSNNLPEQSKQKSKKPLIEILNETETDEKSNGDLPYEIKSTEEGYHIEVLIPGVNSIGELDLKISDTKVKLKINKTEQKVEIQLKNPINSDSAKAKLKKKTQRLVIELQFLHKI